MLGKAFAMSAVSMYPKPNNIRHTYSDVYSNIYSNILTSNTLIPPDSVPTNLEWTLNCLLSIP